MTNIEKLVNHTMSVKIMDWGRVQLRLQCSGHEALLCHYTCTDPNCDEWSYEDHVFPDRRNGVEEGHKLAWRPVCNAVEWMEDQGAEEHFVGPSDTPLFDGMPVKVTWLGDSYGWSAA